MLVTGLDIETTGLEQAKGHRIIELCMHSYDLATERLVDGFTQRIHPQRAITAKAQEVHGISIEDLVGEPHWEDVAPRVAKVLADSDLVVAHNMAFDGPFVALELARIGREIPSFQTFCTMENGRWATPYGKKPNLGELCFAVRVDYDPSAAHAADYDVDRMMRAFFEGVRRGFFTIPSTEDEEAA